MCAMTTHNTRGNSREAEVAVKLFGVFSAYWKGSERIGAWLLVGVGVFAILAILVLKLVPAR